MNTRWFYKHAGYVFGPYRGDELYRLAAIGLLQRTDRIWPEGGDAQAAIEATAAIDFSTLPAPQLDPPDWLVDVAESQASGPQIVDWPAMGTPDWLDDMRQMHGVSGAGMPIKSVPAELAAPAAEAARPQSAPLESGSAASGVHSTPSPEPAESSEAIYERARSALHAWAGLESNKALVLSGDFDAVRRDSAVQVILQMAEHCGPHFADRFARYLEFVVHTRRKSYLAAR